MSRTGEEDVLRLEIAVHHPSLVGCPEPPRDLCGPVERGGEGDRACGEALPEVLPLQQLAHHVEDALVQTHVVNRHHVRMVQGSSEARLLLQPRQGVFIGGEVLPDDLQRDLTVQAPVARPVHLAHPAGADEADDLVDTEL